MLFNQNCKIESKEKNLMMNGSKGGHNKVNVLHVTEHVTIAKMIILRFCAFIFAVLDICNSLHMLVFYVFKDFFLFGCMCVCVCTHKCVGAHGDQTRMSVPLELVVESCSM